jgi:polyisoprenoid-binding protein YceI
MKRRLAAMIAGAALSAAAAPTFAAEVAYTIDPSHTETTFVIDRFGSVGAAGVIGDSVAIRIEALAAAP